jgi:cell wall-associated NlpC family hydrolase
MSFIGRGALHLLKPALLAAGFAGLMAGCALQPPRAAAPAQPLPRAPSGAPAAPAAVDYAALFVANATAMLGQPYRYGGAQPGGFDCSGLVAYAASHAGIDLPRTAQEQLRAGLPVRRSELREGDLVFMHLKGKELHVGIALDARFFVHAPASGGHVRIDSLDRTPYSSGFSAARRVVVARAPP